MTNNNQEWSPSLSQTPPLVAYAGIICTVLLLTAKPRSLEVVPQLEQCKLGYQR